jgi:hypothetical protein
MELNIDTLHDAGMSSKVIVALLVNEFSFLIEIDGKLLFL